MLFFDRFLERVFQAETPFTGEFCPRVLADPFERVQLAALHHHLIRSSKPPSKRSTTKRPRTSDPASPITERTIRLSTYSLPAYVHQQLLSLVLTL